MYFEFISLVALVSTVSVATQPTASGLSFNPPASLVHPDASIRIGSLAPEPETNAKRFAAGLPPLSPRARHRFRAAHRGNKVDTARRSTTSPLPPVNTKCNILARGTDGTEFGFISPVWNGLGQYGRFQVSQDGALEVSFSYLPDLPSQLDFTATNGPVATYLFFGAITGFASESDDFGPGSQSHAFVGGTTQSPAGPAKEGANSFSAATGVSKPFESAIWVYDPTTQAIAAQWINTDGSAPPTHIVYLNDGNDALAMTGDVDALRSAFGGLYPEVTFACSPPVAVQTL